MSNIRNFFHPQIGEEVHLQGAGELRRRSEGNVDVLMEHLGDVRTRHRHALRKLRLRLTPHLLKIPYVFSPKTLCLLLKVEPIINTPDKRMTADFDWHRAT